MLAKNGLRIQPVFPRRTLVVVKKLNETTDNKGHPKARAFGARRNALNLREYSCSDGINDLMASDATWPQHKTTTDKVKNIKATSSRCPPKYNRPKSNRLWAKERKKWCLTTEKTNPDTISQKKFTFYCTSWPLHRLYNSSKQVASHL